MTGDRAREQAEWHVPGFDWCEWCQSWHAPSFKHCKRDTGEPVSEEGWMVI